MPRMRAGRMHSVRAGERADGGRRCRDGGHADGRPSAARMPARMRGGARASIDRVPRGHSFFFFLLLVLSRNPTESVRSTLSDSRLESAIRSPDLFCNWPGRSEGAPGPAEADWPARQIRARTRAQYFRLFEINFDFRKIIRRPLRLTAPNQMANVGRAPKPLAPTWRR